MWRQVCDIGESHRLPGLVQHGQYVIVVQVTDCLAVQQRLCGDDKITRSRQYIVWYSLREQVSPELLLVFTLFWAPVRSTW